MSWRAPAGVAALLISGAAAAHSASDAYLNLERQIRSASRDEANIVVHGQWDIALRDLDFVVKLDDNGDGNITWGELRKHQADIIRYAYNYLHVSADGKDCEIKPTREMVDNHADGAYAALFFDIACSGLPTRITVDYRLFFAVDPSHRGILVFRSGDNTSTSLLSPENPRVELKF